MCRLNTVYQPFFSHRIRLTHTSQTLFLTIFVSMFTSRIFNISEIDSSLRSASFEDSVITYLSDEGASVSLNGNAPFYINAYSYLLIVNGSATLYTNDVSFPLTAGSIILQKPLHNTMITNCSTDFRYSVLVINKEYLNNLPMVDVHQTAMASFASYSNPVINLMTIDSSLINDCIIDVTRQIQRDNHLFKRELIQNALVRFFLELHNALSCVCDDVKTPQTRQTAILRDFFDLLVIHFRKWHNVWFYAQELNITPHYLTRIIKQQTNLTPAEIINELLYNEARYLLLHTSMPIQQIATILSFSDQSAFYKFFKKHAALSPLEFRKSYCLD